MTQLTLKNARELDELIDWAFPDALWIEIGRHSDEAATVYVYDLDYKYTRWLACISLNDRWTLSPRD